MSRTIYEEHIFCKGIALALGLVTVGMLVMTIRQWLALSPSADPVWLNPALFVFFLLLTLNFARLNVVITDEQATIGFGVIRSHTMWRDVVDCYPDETSVLRYGGWGIRIGCHRGKWRLVFNDIGAPRVVLLRRNNSIPEVIFSTHRPEQAVEAVRTALRRAAG
jgi:hypothetical protein